MLVDLVALDMSVLWFMIDLDAPHRSDPRSTELTSMSDLHGLLVSEDGRTLSERSMVHFLIVISTIDGAESFKSVYLQKSPMTYTADDLSVQCTMRGLLPM